MIFDANCSINMLKTFDWILNNIIINFFNPCLIFFFNLVELLYKTWSILWYTHMLPLPFRISLPLPLSLHLMPSFCTSPSLLLHSPSSFIYIHVPSQSVRPKWIWLVQFTDIYVYTFVNLSLWVCVFAFGHIY